MPRHLHANKFKWDISKVTYYGHNQSTLPVFIQILNKAVINRPWFEFYYLFIIFIMYYLFIRLFTLLYRGILATECRVYMCKYALAVVWLCYCLSIFFVAPSLPEAILWRLNLCIISHSALCPRSSVTPATSRTLVSPPHFQDNNSGRQTGSHNVAWLLQTTMEPAVCCL